MNGSFQLSPVPSEREHLHPDTDRYGRVIWSPPPDSDSGLACSVRGAPLWGPSDDTTSPIPGFFPITKPMPGWVLGPTRDQSDDSGINPLPGYAYIAFHDAYQDQLIGIPIEPYTTSLVRSLVASIATNMPLWSVKEMVLTLKSEDIQEVVSSVLRTESAQSPGPFQRLKHLRLQLSPNDVCRGAGTVARWDDRRGVLAAKPSLEKLELDGIYLQESSAIINNLTTLRLWHARPDQTFSAFINMLRRATSLTTLDLKDYHLSGFRTNNARSLETPLHMLGLKTLIVEEHYENVFRLLRHLKLHCRHTTVKLIMKWDPNATRRMHTNVPGDCNQRLSKSFADLEMIYSISFEMNNQSQDWMRFQARVLDGLGTSNSPKEAHDRQYFRSAELRLDWICRREQGCNLSSGLSTDPIMSGHDQLHTAEETIFDSIYPTGSTTPNLKRLDFKADFSGVTAQRMLKSALRGIPHLESLQRTDIGKDESSRARTRCARNRTYPGESSSNMLELTGIPPLSYPSIEYAYDSK